MNDTDQDIVGVRFAEAGAVAYCRSNELALGVGDYVIVRTDRGERLGWVVIAPDQLLASEHRGPLRVIDRLATEDDVEAWQANRRRAQEDISRAQALAARADPRVRVASIEYDLPGERCELTFAASEPIEYEWLKRQATELLGADVQVEQVGDRDRARALGAIDVCGRALCCSTWMTSFPSVSMRMAKEQDLAPNPTKLSGVCGRLMCCLTFEVEQYRELRGNLPATGKRVTTPLGRARILGFNALKQIVRLRLDSGEVLELSADEMRAQYGSTVRPEELEATVEEPLRRQDRERREDTVAVLTPIERPGGEREAEAGKTGERAEGSDEGEGGQRRRRRRGRRGGRKRRQRS